AVRDAVLPPADQFPDWRLPRLRAPLPLRAVADSCAVSRLHLDATGALRHDGEVLDAICEDRRSQRTRRACLAAVRSEPSVPVAHAADTDDGNRRRLSRRPQVLDLGQLS